MEISSSARTYTIRNRCVSTLKHTRVNNATSAFLKVWGAAGAERTCQVTVTRSWREAGETLEDLLERRVRGKAVLKID
jgi:hypothetical protein